MDRKIPTKVKFIVGITFLFVFFGLLYLLARHNAEKGYHRPVSALLNQYYQLRKLNQPEAKQALELILQQDPHNKIALAELQNWNSSKNRIMPSSWVPLPNVYTPTARHQTFTPAELSPNIIAIPQQEIPFSNLLVSTETTQAPTAESLFIDYYNIKASNPEKALLILQEIIEKDPSSNLAYAEMGYLYANEHQNTQALISFEKAYELVPTPQLAIQIAYLLADNKQFLLAELYLEQSIKLSHNEVNPETQKMLATLNRLINPFITRLLTLAPQKIGPNSEYTQLMDQYYNEKKIAPE
ncbi:MAG: hypothetical protein K2Q14_08750, partial [Gammaproteobacteria bacterium]|nr:hypothetical protein [Gammaproteobacteria bacterium]